MTSASKLNTDGTEICPQRKDTVLLDTETIAMHSIVSLQHLSKVAQDQVRSLTQRQNIDVQFCVHEDLVQADEGETLRFIVQELEYLIKNAQAGDHIRYHVDRTKAKA